MPSILDREIDSPERDAFGHRHFAEALRSLIEADANVPPFSIGLLGHWGTGKSTIKELYLTDLHNDTSVQGKSGPRSQRMFTVTFNAWRHGGEEDIKRALLRHVYLDLGGSERELNKEFYHQVQQTISEPKRWRDFGLELFQRWLIPLVPLALLVALVATFAWWLVNKLGLTPGSTVLPISVLLALITVVVKDFFNLKLNPISRFTPVTMVRAPVTSAEQYEALLLKQIRHFKENTGKRCQRLIVFVDDLDRLSAEEMVAGLDTIRSFMEIPRSDLPDDFGIVFVISCDEHRVADALYGRAPGRKSPDLPATVFDLADARHFLDRIFQFRLEIPPFPRRDMREFAVTKLAELPAFIETLPEHIELNRLVDRMIHVGVESPRNAIQILNAFIQSWWIAKKREYETPSSRRSGALREGAVTDHSLCLAALCALKVDFPDFYRHLLLCPELLVGFRQVVFDQRPLEQQPLPVQEALSTFINIRKDTDATKKEQPRYHVPSKYRTLRRFLASIQDLDWPQSIGPLLLLTEDRVSRKLGDRAPAVRDSLVSGDSLGVLEALGRDKDSNPIESYDADLLKGLLDDLAPESAERKDNAAATIATLTPRLPEQEGRALVRYLARRLAGSGTLRCRVGVEQIRQTLPRCDLLHQKLLVGRLTHDVLRTDGMWVFKRVTGQMPNLQEALDIATDVCSLALATRSAIGLDPVDESALLSWLRERTVTVDEKSHKFSFSTLEGWVGQYPELTIPLGLDYTEELVHEFERDELEDFDVEKALSRAESVFERSEQTGGQHRSRMWQQLGVLASARDPAAVALASSFSTKYHENAEAPEVSTVLTPLVTRLEKALTETKWSLETWQELTGACLPLIESRLGNVEGSLSALQSLAQTASSEELSAASATHCVDTLLQTDRKRADTVINTWSSTLLSTTQPILIEWIGSHFAEKLSDSQQQTIVRQLQPVVDKDNLTDAEVSRFSLFFGHLTPDSFETDAIQQYLKTLFAKVASRHNNPDHYLTKLFPQLSRVLHYGPPDETASMLDTRYCRILWPDSR